MSRRAEPWFLRAALFSSLVAALGCGSGVEGALTAPPAKAELIGNPVPPGNPAPAFGPRVFLVPLASGAQILSDRVTIGSTVLLQPASSAGAAKAASALAPGDFLINDFGASTSFVRAITALQPGTGTVIALTRRAGLEEVLQQGAFARLIPQIASGRAASPNAVGLPAFDIPLTLPPVQIGNITVTVLNTSHLAFDPQLDLGMQFGFLSVSEFHAILSGQMTGRLEVNISAALAQVQLSFERQVYQAPDVIIPIAPPLFLDARLKILVGCSVQADETISVDTGFTISGSLTAGGHFANGAWGGDGSLPGFSPIAPAFGAGASLHASCEVRPRLELLLDGLVGPFIDVVPSIYGDLSFSAPPPAIDWAVGWTVTGDLGGTVDVVFTQFVVGPVTIFDVGKQQLASGHYALATGYCNGSADCSTQDCSGHKCITPPPQCLVDADCGAGRICVSGNCQTAPPPDNCAHALDGVYCGYSTLDGFSGKGNGKTLYSCGAHRTTGTSTCPANCYIAPQGYPDKCSTTGDNCAGAADGGYCGFSTDSGFSGQGDAHTIYFCSGHRTTSTSHCVNDCVIAPAGQADYCSSCGGTLCGTRCCPAADWCGGTNQCCSGCGIPGCPC